MWAFYIMQILKQIICVHHKMGMQAWLQGMNSSECELKNWQLFFIYKFGFKLSLKILCLTFIADPLNVLELHCTWICSHHLLQIIFCGSSGITLFSIQMCWLKQTYRYEYNIRTINLSQSVQIVFDFRFHWTEIFTHTHAHICWQNIYIYFLKSKGEKSLRCIMNYKLYKWLLFAPCFIHILCFQWTSLWTRIHSLTVRNQREKFIFFSSVKR